jgi:hypothetical protein
LPPAARFAARFAGRRAAARPSEQHAGIVSAPGPVVLQGGGGGGLLGPYCDPAGLLFNSHCHQDFVELMQDVQRAVRVVLLAGAPNYVRQVSTPVFVQSLFERLCVWSTGSFELLFTVQVLSNYVAETPPVSSSKHAFSVLARSHNFSAGSSGCTREIQFKGSLLTSQLVLGDW